MNLRDLFKRDKRKTKSNRKETEALSETRISEHEEVFISGNIREYEDYKISAPVTYTLHSEYYDAINTRERVDLSVIEPCGFSFSDVILQTNRVVDVETGEIRGEGNIVLSDEDDVNYKKFLNDWSAVSPYLNTLVEYVSAWPADEVNRMTHILPCFNESKWDDNHSHCNRTILVEGLTPTGKAKKYPVIFTSTLTIFHSLNVRERRKDTISIQGFYLKDGTIGKGKINIWVGHNGHLCEFEKSASGYYPKLIKLCHADSPEWVIAYKQNRR